MAYFTPTSSYLAFLLSWDTFNDVEFVEESILQAIPADARLQNFESDPHFNARKKPFSDYKTKRRSVLFRVIIYEFLIYYYL